MHCIVIDENKTDQNLYVKILNTLPYIERLAILSSPSEALTYLKKCENYCVIITEMDFSSQSGIDLAKEIRRINPNTFIIFSTTNTNQAINAFSIHANGYILKPITYEKITEELNYLQIHIPIRKRKTIRAVTFGIFELYINEKRVNFSSKKAKELLAYLINQRGSCINCEQAIAVLWEDRPYDSKTRSLCRMTMTQLRRSLEAVNAKHIIVEGPNYKSIDTSAFECDYYDFLKGDITAIRQYKGEYMHPYYWASDTEALLDFEKDDLLSKKD